MRSLTYPLVSLAGAALLLLSSTAHAQLQPPPPMQPQPQPGLQAPPPLGTQQSNTMIVTPDQQQKAATQQQLNQAEAEDSGRNFELFYVDGQIGGSYINMAQFDSTALGIKKTSAGGPAFSLGAGLRLVVFYIGARIRYNALSSFNLWQPNLELGLKLPISSFDILIGLHGGYSFVGHLGDSNAVADTTSTSTNKDDLSFKGANAGLEVAFDYFVNPMFSVGIGVLGDFLYLHRAAVALPSGLTADQQAQIKNDPLYSESGSSAGLQVNGMLRLGIHLGL